MIMSFFFPCSNAGLVDLRNIANAATGFGGIYPLAKLRKMIDLII